MIPDVLLVVVLPIVLVVVGVVVLGRLRPATGDDSDSVSFAGGVIGALFTVVLAFFVVFAWQIGDDIHSDATVEANALVDAYRQADQMPAPVRGPAQALARDYAQGVVVREWPELSSGRAGPAVAASDATVGSLRALFVALPADDDVMQSTRDDALADVRQVDESHRARVAHSTETDEFTAVLLVATLVGAALMIAFPLVVGISARPANMVAMGLLTFGVAATVYIAIQLSHPLSGPFAVEPTPLSGAVAAMGAAA